MLSKILEKLGVTDYSQLKDQERQTYLQWADILNKPELSIEDLKTILPAEIERVTIEWRKYENDDKRDLYFKVYARILQMLTDMITAPEKEREDLKKRLEKQFNL